MLQSLLDQLFLRMDMAEVSWSVRLRILTQTLLDRTVPVGASQDVVTRMETIIDRLQDARPIVATLQEIIVAIGSNTSSTPFWLLLLRLVPRCSSDDLRDWICQRFRCHCINRAVLAVAQQCFADLPEESALAGVLREYQAIYEDETVGGGDSLLLNGGGSLLHNGNSLLCDDGSLLRNDNSPVHDDNASPSHNTSFPQHSDDAFLDALHCEVRRKRGGSLGSDAHKPKRPALAAVEAPYCVVGTEERAKARRTSASTHCW